MLSQKYISDFALLLLYNNISMRIFREFRKTSKREDEKKKSFRWEATMTMNEFIKKKLTKTERKEIAWIVKLSFLWRIIKFNLNGNIFILFSLSHFLSLTHLLPTLTENLFKFYSPRSILKDISKVE
jgi:hypothetical protein